MLFVKEMTLILGLDSKESRATQALRVITLECKNIFTLLCLEVKILMLLKWRLKWGTWTDWHTR